jgi:FkbM family methyltransferase
MAAPWPGVRFEVNLADRIQRQMWAGIYEPHVRACLDALAGPGHTYFDVGAHIGYHAVAVARKVGEHGRVFAFEADPKMHERLARNLEQFPWAQAVQAAVWEHSGMLTFARSPVTQESGWGTLTNVRDFEDGEHVNVHATSLDDWCRDARLARWDIMKLDAEGSELAVLHGAQKALEEFRPVIIMEVNGILLREAGISSDQVVGFLAVRNYRVLSLSPGKIGPWVLEKHGEFSDTLCLPEPCVEASLQRLARAGFRL